MLAPPLLKRSLDMELTRVRGGGPEQTTGAAATGGDADLLALLLGGNATAASAFPATLEAALAGDDLGEEPLAAGDADGGGTDAGGGATGTIDLALAAALSLGATPAGTVATASAMADGGAANGAAVSATGAVSDAAAVLASGGQASGGAIAATLATAGSATVTVAAAGSMSADSAPQVEAVAATAVEAAEADADKDAAPLGDGSATTAIDTAPASAAIADRAHAGVPRLSRAGDAPPAGKPTAGAPAEHGAGAGIAHAQASSFASGAPEHQGLDLGSSDRHGATVVHEKATPQAASSAGAPAVPEVATTLSVQPADGGSASTVTTTAVGSTPATSHDTGVARAEHAAHHPGGIEPRWGERVADAVRLSAVRGGGEIRLQLEPEGLGHIDVRLHVQGDGVRAVIVAEHESTRALLTSQQQVLHEALQRSDLRLSDFSVDVGSGGGAASFARSEDQGRGGGAPGGPPSATVTTTAPADADATAASLANGRVSVRV
ncbi:MAG: flagellar hook-length control protein FliK [Deltaproteobacteria bacterium]|nr:flagellar hook-length control protein FliK [Deltaproteobacteria bacterium]